MRMSSSVFATLAAKAAAAIAKGPVVEESEALPVNATVSMDRKGMLIIAIPTELGFAHLDEGKKHLALNVVGAVDPNAIRFIATDEETQHKLRISPIRQIAFRLHLDKDTLAKVTVTDPNAPLALETPLPESA